MPKRMVWFSQGETITWRVLDLRQGLDPLPRLDLNPSYNSGSQMDLALSTDQSILVHGIGSSNNNAFIYKDPANLGNRMAATAAFSGNVCCVAVSQDYYVFGGNSPSTLMVYQRSDDSLVNVDKTGLSIVGCAAFSLDGEYLAITHITSPCVRIYKTSDWSYINVATAVGSNNSCIFSGDGSKLLVASNSPYFSVYDTITGVRLFSNSTAPYLNFNYGRLMGRHPANPDVILLPLLTTPFIGTWDFSTNTKSLFTAVSPVISTATGILVDPDPEEDAVYLFHTPGSSGRTMTKFRISTGTAYENQPPMYRNILYGSTIYTPASAIVTTTPYRLRGTLRDVNNNPVGRVVRAYKNDTGELMAQTTSHPVTGEYTLKLYDAGPYDVQFMTEPGETLNDLFFSNSEPEPL